MIRIARVNGTTVKAFLKFYECESVLKSALDIDSNWNELERYFPSDFLFPEHLINKLQKIDWQKGRSKWLIFPNKKGSAQFNSYTKFCAICLTEKSYYQQKWKVSVFEACAEHSIKLQNKCPNCGNAVSPLKSEMRTYAHDELSPIFHCWFCKFDIRLSPVEILKSIQQQDIKEITISYSENPCNLVYLKFILNSLP